MEEEWAGVQRGDWGEDWEEKREEKLHSVCKINK